MYTTLKRMGVFCTIACCLHIVSAVMVFLYYQAQPPMDFENEITLYLALISTPILFICSTIAMLALHTDLCVHNQSEYEEMAAMRKRIDELETQSKVLDGQLRYLESELAKATAEKEEAQ